MLPGIVHHHRREGLGGDAVRKDEGSALRRVSAEEDRCHRLAAQGEIQRYGYENLIPQNHNEVFLYKNAIIAWDTNILS